MTTSTALKIKNKHLMSLCQFIAALPLGGQESRERTRFIEVVSPRITEMEAERVSLLKKYAEKDDKDQPIMVEDTKTGRTSYDLGDEGMASFTKEYEDYANEEFVLDILDGNISKVKTIKNLVLNTDEKFNGATAAEYDAWCQAFEALSLD